MARKSRTPKQHKLQDVGYSGKNRSRNIDAQMAELYRGDYDKMQRDIDAIPRISFKPLVASTLSYISTSAKIDHELPTCAEEKRIARESDPESGGDIVEVVRPVASRKRSAKVVESDPENDGDLILPISSRTKIIKSDLEDPVPYTSSSSTIFSSGPGDSSTANSSISLPIAPSNVDPTPDQLLPLPTVAPSSGDQLRSCLEAFVLSNPKLHEESILKVMEDCLEAGMTMEDIATCSADDFREMGAIWPKATDIQWKMHLAKWN